MSKPNAAPALRSNASIQMGSLLIACTVKSVLRNGAQIVLTDASNGSTYTANRGRNGVYKVEGAYRVRLGSDTDNRATWMD